MKKTITILALAFTALMVDQAKSQTPGQVDLSFNPHYDGCTKYNTNNPGTVFNVNNNGSGKVYLSGDFYFYNGNASRHIARINTDGTYDNTFNVGTGLDSLVRSSALQSDGKILLGGAFSSYNGTSASRIIRLNTNGSIDTAFNTNIGTGPNDYVRFVSLQTDGKILLGGAFTSFNGISASRVVRLNTDGTIDNTFNVGAGTDDFVRVVTEQSDGKILVGGNFLNFAGSAVGRIVRLNANGTQDLTFAPSSGFDNAVTTIAVQTDGKILVGGMFSTINGTVRNRMARLNANGTIDTTFAIGTGFMGDIWKITIAVDNKMLVCGDFWQYNDSTYHEVMRMLPSGAGDITFNTDIENNKTVFSIADGDNNGYIIGGNFSKYVDAGGNSYLDKKRYAVCGIKSNGSFDESFNYHTDADKTVYSTDLQQDGKIIIAGKFTQFDGDTTKIGLARLNVDGTLDTTFQPAVGVDDYFNLYSAIAKVHVQTDGKILVTGLLAMRNNGHLVGNNFTTARLNTNGTIDATFSRDSVEIAQASVIRADGKIYIAYNGASGFIKLLNDDGTVDNSFVLTPTLTSLDAQVFYNINQLKIDANNKLLVACSGTKVNGTERSLFRINPDGTLDATFNTAIPANQNVKAIDLNTDGSIIIGGYFNTVNGIACTNLAKLNNDGTSNLSFNAINTPYSSVNSLKIQVDGKIVIGGSDYSTSNLYKRYNTDGTVDNTFITQYVDNNGFSGTEVNTVTIQPDGNIILGGNFNGFSNTWDDYGVRKNNIARVFGGVAAPVAPNANAGADKALTCIATTVVLDGSSTTAGVSYSWSGPGIISGGATATPTVNATGTYTLTVTDLGNSLTSTDQVIVNTNTSVPNVSAGSGSAICSGNSTTLNGSSSTTGVTYNWYGPGIVSGGSTLTPTVNAVGSYTLTVTDPANGCTANDVVAVTAGTAPATPTITQNGSTLTSSSSTGNQWYLDGTAIPGATSQTYTYTAIGDYTVIVTNSSCSSASSAITTIISVGIAENNFENQITIYPSPAQDFFIIEGNFNERIKLTLTNISGKQVVNKMEDGFSKKYELNTEHLSNGIYLLTIEGESKQVMRKVNVIH